MLICVNWSEYLLLLPSKCVSFITIKTIKLFPTLAHSTLKLPTTTTKRTNNDSDDIPQDPIAENSMAVLPSSINKLKKRGMFRSNSRKNSVSKNDSNNGDDDDINYRSEMEDEDDEDDDDTESPPEPLPLYQQRENYFT